MNLIDRVARAFSRPEYFYRPSQVIRRIKYQLRPLNGHVWVKTPWGLPLFVDADELYGRTMLTMGAMDIALSEILWRLIEPGDHVVDIGANIGFTTALMAWRTGAHGKVTAFEPHPHTRAFLEASVTRWRESLGIDVSVYPFALSAKSGNGRLEEPPQFASNSGVARLASEGRRASGPEVEVRTFDWLLSQAGKIKVVKIDVEGHEDQVVEGMVKTLAQGNVDHLVIEEFRPLPSPLCHTLVSYGFSSFLIERELHRPRLIPVEERPSQRFGEAPNIYATRNISVLRLLSRRGWDCLK